MSVGSFRVTSPSLPCKLVARGFGADEVCATHTHTQRDDLAVLDRLRCNVVLHHWREYIREFNRVDVLARTAAPAKANKAKL